MAPTARALIDTVCRCVVAPPGWSPDRQDAEPGGYDWSHGRSREIALRNTRALMCEAVQRNKCTVDDIVQELEAAAMGGSALARRAAYDIVAGCRSAPECELRDLVRSSRILPEPRWNKPLPGYGKISPDACWEAARLVVEVDSMAWHGFGDAPEKTENRRALYGQLGWVVIPVSPRRLRAQTTEVRRQVEQAYQAGMRLHGHGA